MPIEALLAFRFLTYAMAEKSIASMLKICFFSITLGTSALTVVSAVMNGLEKATYKKLQGIHADIYIDAGQQAIDYPKLQKVLATTYSSSVSAATPSAFFHALIAHNQNDGAPGETPSALCIVKVLDPTTEPLVTTLHKAVIPSASPVSASSMPRPWSALSSSSIYLGKTLAEKLNLKEGDTATLFYPEEQTIHRHTNLLSYPVTIGALYKTGIQDLDEQILIASFDLFKKLYHPAVRQVMLKLAPHVSKKEVIDSLRARTSLSVYGWEELYTPLLAALTLEKYAMFFIGALISVVASSTIIALLFMYATQKRMEIAVLQSMGAKNAALRKLFIYVALSITTSATLCGIVIAAGITYLLQRFPFIPLPDAYYVTHLPAELSFSIILAVFVCAFIMALIAALIPSRKMRSLPVAAILKGLPS